VTLTWGRPQASGPARAGSRLKGLPRVAVAHGPTAGGGGRDHGTAGWIPIQGSKIDRWRLTNLCPGDGDVASGRSRSGGCSFLASTGPYPEEVHAEHEVTSLDEHSEANPI
jgi:hypothetical protein